MNSYFATCEQQANPHLRGKPIAVGGDPRVYRAGGISRSRTMIVAASREAKARGVKSVMPSWEALAICPDLIFIEGDGVKYRCITDKFLKIFESYSPNLEIFSIDEVFLEIAENAELDPSHEGGAGAENAEFNTNKNKAVEIAKEIKLRLKQEVGEWMTCSIGIAENKLLAKLASDLKKPDGLVIIDENNKDKILNSIELTDFCGIGKRIEIRLNKMGIKTVKELRACLLEKLIREFKSYGHKLYLMARGIDNSPVIPYWQQQDEKSMGHNFTLPKDIYKTEEIKAVVLKLSERVGRRLRNKGFMGRRVSLLLRYAFYQEGELPEVRLQGKIQGKPRFEHFHKQKKVNYWFSDGYEIYKIACEILGQWKDRRSVRMIGVSVADLTRLDQLSCLEEIIKQKSVLRACDKINNKYGEETVFRGGILEARKFGDAAMPSRQSSFLKRK